MDWKDNLLIQRDDDSVLDYVFVWSAWLNGDTIQSHTVAADAGINVDSSVSDDSTVTVWLSGGVPGTKYAVTVQVTTAAGRTDDRTVFFMGTDR